MSTSSLASSAGRRRLDPDPQEVHATMLRNGTLAALMLLFTGCGLVETGATAAAGAQSAAQQAAEAKRTEDQVRQQVEQAQRTEAAQRAAAEQDAR
jgi:hypothetical protein